MLATPLLLYSTLLYFTLLYFTLLYFTLLYFTLLYFTLRYVTLLYFTLLYFALLYVTLLYFTLLYFTLIYFTLFYFTLLYFTLLYFTLLYFTLFYFTLLYFTSLYFTLLYFTIFGGWNCYVVWTRSISFNRESKHSDQIQGVFFQAVKLHVDSCGCEAPWIPKVISGFAVKNSVPCYYAMRVSSWNCIPGHNQTCRAHIPRRYVAWWSTGY